MSNSFSLDPSYQIAKVFIRIGMFFSAAMVAVLIYIAYLASLGIFEDWEREIQSAFGEFQLDTTPFFWQLLMLSIAAIAFLVSFFVLGWLGKRIQTESKSQQLVG
ncbi:hypothetical protein [Algoriphagus chordae]|uniref:Uncharacterized protein n=1 Tax=Algoriphagus chordae TaxID=237019 RepID=A0A2W7R1T0_9BACT|nr:hypothetical protein [Algoriphagus chordae]PZX53186.1 hypothetical protein LV85_01601 [Algoriphagus chordae]